MIHPNTSNYEIVHVHVLFNARRGGEPSGLLPSEWDDADKGAWIDPQRISTNEDPLEKSLLKSFQIYLPNGKGEFQAGSRSHS